MWLVTAMISSAGFALAALTLLFLAWKTSKIFQYSCCPIAVLPDTLVTFLFCFIVFMVMYIHRSMGKAKKSRHMHMKTCSSVMAELVSRGKRSSPFIVTSETGQQKVHMSSQLSCRGEAAHMRWLHGCHCLWPRALSRDNAPGACRKQLGKHRLTLPDQLLPEQNSCVTGNTAPCPRAPTLSFLTPWRG